MYSNWVPESDIALALKTSEQKIPEDSLFIQPVTNWSKFPDYLMRMPVDKRASFLHNVEQKYKLTIRDGKLVSLDSIEDQEANDRPESSTGYNLIETGTPTERVFESTKEPIEEPSKLWLWLIGVFILSGGVTLLLKRRKR